MGFMTLMAAVGCFADVTGVADTSKEGSLLIWPSVVTDGDNDTYIIITNSDMESERQSPDDDDFTDDDRLVNIKCYWEVRQYPWVEGDGTSCPIRDLVFFLSERNPIIFRASDGTDMEGNGVVPPMGQGMRGMLKCWAISPNDTNQIAWNHLSGHAIIVKPRATELGSDKESAWKYSAWRFAANIMEDDNGTDFAEGFWVGKTLDGNGNFNTMKLWGANRVITSASSTAPTCADPTTELDCCPTGTKGIKMGRTWDTSPVKYTYYCIQKVNGAKCQWPYDKEENGNGCKKDAAVYDACPKYLLFDFLAEPTPGQEDGLALNYLALAPCKEDLRTDDDAMGEIDTSTRLVFTVWNKDERKFTGHYSCPHCNGPPGSTYDIYLSDLHIGGINYFQEKYLQTSSGRFRVEGAAGGKCGKGTAIKTPLVGIMASKLINSLESTDIIATSGTSAGAEVNTVSLKDDGKVQNLNPAWIKWDPSTEVYEKKNR